MSNHNPSPHRRRVLKAVGGLGIGLAAGPLGVPRVFAQKADAILKREIPSSGERIPAVGLGTARTFDVGDVASASQETLAGLRSVLETFHRHGGRVLDTSPMYGTAETLTGRFAEDLGLTDDLWMATKVWTDGEQAGKRQMRRSMELLRSEPLDLMQIHNLRDWRTHYPTLRAWKEAGTLRHIGITRYRSDAHEEVERVLDAERFDFLQINYNVLDRKAADRLLPLCADRGIATLINVPFGNGALFRKVRGRELPEWAADFDAESWAQVFLKFILSHPAVTCAIPATSDPGHVADNTRAVYGRLPDAGQRRRIVTYLEAL